ncbi:hypothetical protein H1Z61_04150 [Bacillus aquiflavi]|uniref:Lipoprotein n=1 Tax=Bacillus aquiflavi TaxID=2672567 RepID=A0A6B3VYP1_9BACI|nr:DUF6612 family protein [Bacillus aquiflavi]MBA4536353.1 hypothetical protein [Bacillus aquiflavi]NEY80721.1 hypothetical protein [Bacillus aquiflavi]
MKKLVLPFLLVISIFTLAGCGQLTPKDLFDKVNNAHKDIESVEIKFTESSKTEDEDEKSTGIQKMDFKKDVSYIKFNEDDMILYKDKKETLLFYDGFELGLEEDEKKEYKNYLKYNKDRQKNQLAFLQQFDDKLFEKFELKEEKDTYILTYKGSKEDKKKLLEAMSSEYYKELSKKTKHEIVDVEVFDLTFKINKKTYLIEQYQYDQKFTEKLDGEESKYDRSTTYHYSKYNKVKDIKKPKETSADSGDDEKLTLSKEEQETYEKEAANYVSALIQATVYQNVDGYVENAPDTESQEEKVKSAEHQKSAFRSIYIENGKNTMQSVGAEVSDSQFETLADGFLNALSKTKYEIVGAKAEGNDSFVVTLKIEGFNDGKLISETQAPIQEQFQQGNLTEQEFVDKIMESLAQAYNGEITLEAPVEMDVNVIRNNDGTYIVALQDQYLGGFVQY